MSVFSSIVVLLGSLLFLAAALGVLRLPDTLSRMQAVTKASSLALPLILFGTAIELGSMAIVLKSLLIIFFIFFTIPVANQLLAHASVSKE
jgi:multicomponent Na+:H+ antiporter subunit G